MANVFISPTRFTPRGTNNSIPTALAVGWPSSMPLRMEGSASTRNSSCKARIIEFIRSIWRVEIPRAIRIAFREQLLVTGDAVRVGRFSWNQSRYGNRADLHLRLRELRRGLGAREFRRRTHSGPFPGDWAAGVAGL